MFTEAGRILYDRETNIIQDCWARRLKNNLQKGYRILGRSETEYSVGGSQK
jgi:hypothetical protein